MNKPLAMALLAVGVVLLIFGVESWHSMASGVSRAFTGSPTDKAVWLIIGGVLSTTLGFIGLARSSRA